MILLSDRQKKILRELWNNPDGIQMNTLEDALKISRRTVYREFSELKLYLSEHGLKIENNAALYFLEGTAAAKTKLAAELNTQKGDTALTTKQRQAAIVCLLLLNHEPVKIFSLAVSLGVSEGTIQRDLKRVSKALASYQIKLDAKKAVGIQVVGEEAQRRLILCGTLTNEINEYEFFEYLDANNHKQTQSFFLRLLPKDVLQRCVVALEEAQIASRARSDMQEVQLVLMIAISLIRMKKVVIKKYAAVGQEKIFQYRQRALEIFTKFSAQIKEKITTGEVDFIAVQLQGLDYHLGVSGWADNYDLQVSYNVKQLIQLISAEIHWNFGLDQDLFSRLVRHMTLLLHSDSARLPNARIEILNSVGQQYPELYNAVKKGLHEIFSKYSFSETEAQLILLYFANSYSSGQTRRQLRALIVCPNGIGTASILKGRLHKEIPAIAAIRIAKVSQLNELDPAEYDLILSTLDLPGFDWKYYIVSPLLLDDELERIKALISKYTVGRQHQLNVQKQNTGFAQGQQRLDEMFARLKASKELLSRIKVTQVAAAPELETVLELILEKIPTQIITDRVKVRHEMIARAELAPVGIPDTGIALVHTTDESVKRPFFSVYQLARPLEMLAMDQTPLEVVRVMLMVGPAPMSDFQNILMGLISSAIVMNSNNTHVFEEGTEEQIKDLIATQFMDQIDFKRKR
ncbi:BglG family transcription antiterminator [Liquorilactobacillus satsumensis]|uniref:BglG family transcription antiterminator n=1 Tax=Liquorilactobacillus satsumensis TaxID=259059 RepID=UPI0021C4A4BB|nr:helix-turn-helix domain-containing protein [Liquorilactobacillus satsumensis]MCP9328973.1 BglG family transcription antiterminator [Liquorilactobacillus satsumensis]